MRANRSIFGLSFQTDSAPELLRTIHRLLEGVALHAVEVDGQEVARFREDIRNIAARITLDATAEDRALATGEAIKALQEYGRNVRSLTEAQRSELMSVVAMLTKTLNLIVSRGTGSQLTMLERKLESATGLDDIRVLKLHLNDCLQIARQEICHQRELTAQAQVALADARTEAANLAAQVRSQDPLTGLPNRRVAEDVLAAHCGRKSAFAAIIVMARLYTINARYGIKTGDEMIRHTARQLVQDLNGFSVHRWGGPSFLAFTDAEDSVQMTQSRLRTIPPLQISNISGNRSRERSLMLPVSTAWTVYSLELETGLSSIVPKLDSFVASQVGPVGVSGEG